MSGRNLFLLCVAAMLAISWMAGEFWLLPMRAEARREQLQAAEIRQEVQEIDTFTAAYGDKKALRKEMEMRERAAKAHLPDHLEQSAMIASLEDMAASSKVTLLEIQPEDVRQMDGFMELPVRVELQADYFCLLDFLEQAEHGERFWQVKEMEVKRKNGILHCRMCMGAYALAQ